MKNHNFLIIGGDLRYAFLANSLQKEGYGVSLLGLENQTVLKEGGRLCTHISEAEEYSVVILPLPATNKDNSVFSPLSEKKISVFEVMDCMEKGSVLMGGRLTDEVQNYAKKKGIEVFDYCDREEFAVRNASLTAEAALASGLEAVRESIIGLPVLVMGHGRIGRLLSAMLKALDADVSVAARRYSDLAWIKSEGLNPIEFSKLNEKIHDFRLIFNTVPAMVLDKERLSLLEKTAVVIDVATSPGGTDFTAAGELGICAENSLGLPGKFAPKTAGEIIKETVLNILTERRAGAHE